MHARLSILLVILAAPACNPLGAPGSGYTDWGTNATEHRGENGFQYGYDCPPNGSAGSVWGTDTYTDDSSICTAAVHYGLIGFAGGGSVTIEISPGLDSYSGSDRNGVSSSDYGSWSGSYFFP
jgi:hypothetical protein